MRNLYEFERHAFVMECPELAGKRDKYEKMMTGQAAEEDYTRSILFLSRCLETYYEKKAIVLMDEYDVPLENAFAHGFYDRMLTCIKGKYFYGIE